MSNSQREASRSLGLLPEDIFHVEPVRVSAALPQFRPAENGDASGPWLQASDASGLDRRPDLLILRRIIDSYTKPKACHLEPRDQIFPLPVRIVYRCAP